MNTSYHPSSTGDPLPGPLTPEKIRPFRAHVAAVHARGVDAIRLPDHVEELVKARDAGSGA